MEGECGAARSSFFLKTGVLLPALFPRTPMDTGVSGFHSGDLCAANAALMPSEKKGPELSVVILGYREEDRLPAFVETVEKEVRDLGISYEIIVVANYWPALHDRTPQVAGDLAEKNPHISVVAKPKQGRMGWDMRSGLERTQGDLLAVIDGDGQFQPHDIARLYQELHAKRLDLCQTYRVARADGWKRRVISKIYNGVFSILFPRTGLCDINAKPKLMTRQMYESLRLNSNDWFIDAEIVIQSRRLNYRMGQIPSVFGKKEGKSYINFSSLMEFVVNLFKFRIRELRK
jgi:glycosyltransferase involved in cell wall biosynthesis